MSADRKALAALIHEIEQCESQYQWIARDLRPLLDSWQTQEAVLDDQRAGYKQCSTYLDRFRDVVAEVTGHGDENPGDDVMLTELRTMHGFSGPEPTRWRDFLTGAVARLDQIRAMPDPGDRL